MQQVARELCARAGSGRPEVNEQLRPSTERIAAPLDGSVRPPHQHGERARMRAHEPTAHGRVDDRDVSSCDLLAQLLGGAGADR